MRLSDPQTAINARAGLTRVRDLIAVELGQDEAMIPDATLDTFPSRSAGLRPLFTIHSAQFGPTPAAPEVTVAGAAIELMHLAALWHDEVVDDVGMRGGPTSTLTRRSNNVAILAGDYRFATASRLGARLGQRAFQVIVEAFSELVRGKTREAIGAARDADPIEHYLRCAQEKTGSLVAAAGQLGATFGGADEADRRRLARLGRLIGTARQICEDNADIAGSLRRGVHSLPLLYALREEGPQTDRLRTTLTGPVTEDSIDEAISLVHSSSGAVGATKALDTYTTQAREILDSLRDCDGRQGIAALIPDPTARPA